MFCLRFVVPLLFIIVTSYDLVMSLYSNLHLSLFIIISIRMVYYCLCKLSRSVWVFGVCQLVGFDYLPYEFFLTQAQISIKVPNSFFYPGGYSLIYHFILHIILAFYYIFLCDIFVTVFPHTHRNWCVFLAILLTWHTSYLLFCHIFDCIVTLVTHYTTL